MNKQITHITISTHEHENKLGEIAFFDPLGGGERRAEPPLKQHSPFYLTHTLFQKGQTLLKQIFFKNVKYFFISKGTSNEERKCKTILALFLSQKSLADYYLKDHQKRRRFIAAVEAAAKEMGYTFPPLSSESEEGLIEELLTISGEKNSLLTDAKALHRSLLSLGYEERERLLHILLHHLERIPLTSLIEVERAGETFSFATTTHHGRTELSEREIRGELLFCNKHVNRSKPTAHLHRHHLSDQHLVFDSSEEKKELLCALCGNLETSKKVLEQILFILDHDPQKPLCLEEDEFEHEERILCCISYYAWHELDLILAEKSSLETLNQKNLHFTKSTGEKCVVRLHLMHYNIPLSNWYEPKETKATLRDLNDECLLELTLLLCKKEGWGDEELETLFREQSLIRGEERYLEKKSLWLKLIDLFRTKKEGLASFLRGSKSSAGMALSELLLGGGNRYEIDQILYMDHVLEGLNILHNHNSNQLMKLLGAEAAVKAARGYAKVEGRAFLACGAGESEKKLFQFLYSIYMLLEEPRLHAALSGGFLHEEHYYEALCKNRQLCHYLSPIAEQLLRT